MAEKIILIHTYIYTDLYWISTDLLADPMEILGDSVEIRGETEKIQWRSIEVEIFGTENLELFLPRFM